MPQTTVECFSSKALYLSGLAQVRWGQGETLILFYEKAKRTQIQKNPGSGFQILIGFESCCFTLLPSGYTVPLTKTDECILQ